jgi:N-acetylglutamate synthase-like GNAT family acetyltransferase
MIIHYTTELRQVKDIFQLYEKLDWNSFLQLDQEQLLKAMERSWYVIYAYTPDELIGTGRVVSDGITNAYVCGLGVVSDYRNKGIGTEIMKMLVKQCVDSGLHIQFFCEENLVPYYEKMDFEVFSVGMRPKKIT